MLGLTVRAQHLKPGWGVTDAMLCEAGCTLAVDNLNPKTSWNPYRLWDLGQDSSPLFSAFVKEGEQKPTFAGLRAAVTMSHTLPSMQ